MIGLSSIVPEKGTSNMIIYELLYIIAGQYTDSEIDGVRDIVIKMIEKEGGSVSRHENLGKIKLAYPIQGMRHGTYVIVHIEIEPDGLKNLDGKLRLGDDVLRHQFVIIPESARKRKYQINSYVPPLSEEARQQKREIKKSPVPKKVMPAPIAPPVLAKVEDTTPAMSMEELDKKLDKILEGDVT